MAGFGWGRLAVLGAGALVLGAATAALLPGQVPLANATTPAIASASPPPAVATSAPTATPSPRSTTAPSPSPSATSIALKSDAQLQPALVVPKKGPAPATRERKAKRVPAQPPDSYIGRRIVYDKALMTVWLVEANGNVVGQYPVVGRWDRPLAGVYHVYSKSPSSGNPFSKVTFNHMTRFAHGYTDERTPIGFHSIPKYYDGSLMHDVDQLGLPIATGGCVRMSDEAAAAVYEFAKIGTMVVVLPSP